jgi:hypothetical protein
MKSSYIFILLVVTIFLNSCAFTPYQFDNNLRAPSSAESALLLPSSEEDVDKLKILMAIHEEIPDIFSDAARYDINLFDILADQDKLQKLLNVNPDFQRLWTSKKLSDFTFKVKSKDGNQIESKQITEEALTQWKQQLKFFLKNNQNINLEKIILERLEKNGKLTSAGMINGLILNLPKDTQPKAREFQKNKNEDGLVSLLKNNLPESLPNFKAEGIAANPKRDELLKLYKDIVLSENSIGPYIDTYSFSSFRNQSITEFYKQIDSLDRHDLENLNDPDYQTLVFEKLQKKEKAKAPAVYSKYLKTYVDQTQVLSFSEKFDSQVSIKEQNPNIAIFRGCTGGDCSSQFSFPYPNDPNERVFFIYDDKNQVKGYLTGTMITIGDNEKAFYAITISGNRVNAVDTDIILQGLYNQREALGVKHIVLPANENLARLINFTEISSIFEKANGTHSKIPLQYQNTELRGQIETFESNNNNSAYDHMKSNLDGIIYKPNNSDELNLQVDHKTYAIELKKLQIKEKFDSTALIEFILAMKKSDRLEIIDRVIETGFDSGAKQDASRKFLELISLQSIITTEQLNDEIESIAKTLELDPVRLKNKKTQWFINAFLNTEDARSPENLPANLDKLIWDLRNNNPPLVNVKFFDNFKQELYKHKDYKKLMDYLEKKVLNNDIFLNELNRSDMRLALLADYINTLASSSDKSDNIKAQLILKRLNILPDTRFYSLFKSEKLLKEIIKDGFDKMSIETEKKAGYSMIYGVVNYSLRTKEMKNMPDVFIQVIKNAKKVEDSIFLATLISALEYQENNLPLISEVMKLAVEVKNVYALRAAIDAYFPKDALTKATYNDFLNVLSAAAELKDSNSLERIIKTAFFMNTLTKDDKILRDMINATKAANAPTAIFDLIKFMSTNDELKKSYNKFLPSLIETAVVVSESNRDANFFYNVIKPTIEMPSEKRVAIVLEVFKALSKIKNETSLFYWYYDYEPIGIAGGDSPALMKIIKDFTFDKNWDELDRKITIFEGKKIVPTDVSCNSLIRKIIKL